MPIYAYKCESCGHTKDVLQRMADAPLTDCPQCGAATFAKQVTAAGFQLKGSGWYATDFRGGAAAPAPAAETKSEPKADSKAPASPASTPTASTAPSASAGGCGASCGCH